MDYGVLDPTSLGATTLPDGRKLGWAQWGPAHGTPVLFFSGAALGRSLGFGGHVLDRQGVRLIAVDRPGLGASDPAPGRTLEDWAGDIRSLLDAWKLSACSVVGFSQGAPFALACAAAGIASSVALVSGQDDFNDPSVTERLEPDVASLVRNVASAPGEVENSFARMANAEMMWSLIAQSSSAVDLDVYTDPAFRPALLRALDEGFAQGAAGYARDLVVAMTRWPFDVADIKVPVELWYGGHDASTVHSPDRGITLARRIPMARRHLVPKAGGSLLWTHAEEILESLQAAARSSSCPSR